MEKKEYQKMAMKVFELKKPVLLAGSAGDEYDPNQEQTGQGQQGGGGD